MCLLWIRLRRSPVPHRRKAGFPASWPFGEREVTETSRVRAEKAGRYIVGPPQSKTVSPRAFALNTTNGSTSSAREKTTPMTSTMAKIIPEWTVAPHTPVFLLIREVTNTRILRGEFVEQLFKSSRNFARGLSGGFEAYPSLCVISRYWRRADRDVVAHGLFLLNGTAGSFRVRREWYFS